MSGGTSDAGDARFRELASHLPDYVVLVDSELRYRWVNRIAEGLTEQQVYASRVQDFCAAEDMPMIREKIDRCFATGDSASYENVAYGDGIQAFHYETRVMRGAPVDGEARVMLLVRDVSAQATAEAALRKSEERFRVLLESSPDFILAINEDLRVAYVNRVAPGFNLEKIEGQSVSAVMGPDGLEHNLAIIRAAIEDKVSGEYRARQPGMADRHFFVRVLPMDGPAEIRALMIIEDVTEKKKARSELEMSQERLERALSACQVGFYDLDLETGKAKVWGPLKEQVAIRSLQGEVDFDLETIHPDDRDKVAGFARQLSRRTDPVDLMYRVATAENAYRWVNDRSARVEEPGARARITGMIVDVTELQESEQQRRELQQHLEQVQRLESIGLLAGGIAHDFNNLLLVIQSGTVLAKRRIQNDAAIEDFQEVLEAAERAAQLTGQLLAFSRRSHLTVELVDLGQTAKTVFSMAQRILPKSITCSLEQPDQPLLVSADARQLEQVLLNLCVNARDAMPEGGTLALVLQADAGFATLSVSDSGTGIAEEDRQRIFEPFFTTKAVGRGTGLGLAMVHGIVQQLHGQIIVTSELEKGTTFALTLPLSQGEIADQKDAPAATFKGSARILVADDEVGILRVIVQILGDAGFEVVTAQDGMEALELFRPGAFDLVLLDVVMPRLDGWKAYERIRELDATVPVLFSSGFSANVITGEANAPPILRKPYNPDALLVAVHTQLASGMRKQDPQA